MNISAESSGAQGLEIGHVLFMDVVGYSQLLNAEQREVQRRLTEIVRNCEHFRAADAIGKLVRLPAGDGMALVFFNSPDAPAYCALEVARALKSSPHLRLRMGIHSGPVSGLTDVNDRSNVAGAGINMAQRIMDCGDAGHILLSKRAADDLAQDAQLRPCLHDLGECQVKHGVEVSVVNLYDGELGNAAVPEKIRKARHAQAMARRRWIIFGAAAAVLLAASVTAWIHLRRPMPLLSKSVAVLPLENLSDEKENAYFAEGIQDELLSNLAKIKDLKVISRTSVMQYKTGVARNVKEIARQLGVSSVVEGTVSRSGNHVRVSVQLIDALNDQHIWAEVYDRTLADSVALQGELATVIAHGVGASLSPQEKARVEATPTKNTGAYDAYLRGRALAAGAQAQPKIMASAIQSLQKAVQLDANFALAWAYLSCLQSQCYWDQGDATPARMAAAKEAFDRAFALDPSLPEVHLALGYYRYYVERDFTGALAEFLQAEQGLPNNVDVIQAIGLIQRRLGHWDEAIAQQRLAVELDPRNTKIPLNLATTYGVVRRFPEALASINRVLSIEPTNSEALSGKATILWAMGDLPAVELLLANPGVPPDVRTIQALLQRRYPEATELLSKIIEAGGDEDGSLSFLLGLSQQRAGDAVAARATFQKVSQIVRRKLETVVPHSGKEADLHSLLGRAYAGLGEAASAVAEGEKGMALQPTSTDPFEGPEKELDMAMIYALLGDADHAIPILRRLLQMPCGLVVTSAMLRIELVWDSIRNDPRFQELAASKQ